MNIRNFDIKGSGVYKILNVKNGRSYIGSSENLKKRIWDHLQSLLHNEHHSYKLQADFRRYNVDDFDVSILELCGVMNLIQREQFYIDSQKPYYNIAQVAGSSLGVKRSDETKMKVSLGLTGKKQSAETRKKKSEACRGDKHWTKKRKFTEESKLKMSETHKRLYSEGKIKTRKGQTASLQVKQRSREWMSGAIWVTKDGIDKLIQMADFADAIIEGWVRGRIKRKGRVWITNGVKNMLIQENDIKNYPEWTKGFIKKNKNEKIDDSN